MTKMSDYDPTHAKLNLESFKQRLLIVQTNRH
jgi:hypothetical protein